MTTRDTSFLDPEIAAMLQPVIDAGSYDGKFAPKLTLDERCSILAASAYGTTRPVLAAAFNVDRRTITHITNRASPHYRNVRALYDSMGHQEFIKKFLTKDVMDRVNKAFNDPDVRKTTTQLRADAAARLSAQSQKDGPNPNAKKREGRQSIITDGKDGLVTVFHILWCADRDPAAWYLFGEDDTTMAIEGPFNTSVDAYQTAKEAY